jgi:hypothetical protein
MAIENIQEIEKLLKLKEVNARLRKCTSQAIER